MPIAMESMAIAMDKRTSTPTDISCYGCLRSSGPTRDGGQEIPSVQSVNACPMRIQPATAPTMIVTGTPTKIMRRASSAAGWVHV